METRRYKTLRGLLSQTSQLNFNDFHANKFVHKKGCWMGFSLPEEEKDKGYKILAGAIYSNGNKMYYNLKNYWGRSFGILNNLFFERKSLSATYCAGQDYDSETRLVKRIFRKYS